jgi:hypothetical protein
MSNLMAHLRAGGFNNDSIAVCLCILAAAMLQAYVIWRGARAFRAASYRIMATVMPSILKQQGPQRKQGVSGERGCGSRSLGRLVFE